MLPLWRHLGSVNLAQFLLCFVADRLFSKPLVNSCFKFLVWHVLVHHLLFVIITFTCVFASSIWLLLHHSDIRMSGHSRPCRRFFSAMAAYLPLQPSSATWSHVKLPADSLCSPVSKEVVPPSPICSWGVWENCWDGFYRQPDSTFCGCMVLVLGFVGFMFLQSSFMVTASGSSMLPFTTTIIYMFVKKLHWINTILNHYWLHHKGKTHNNGFQGVFFGACLALPNSAL